MSEQLEKKVMETLKKIKLSKKDKILVAVSGGGDSSVTAYLLKKFGYNIEGIHINLGVGDYSKKCMNSAKKLCQQLGVKLPVYDLKKEQGKTMKDFWREVGEKKKLNNCAVCGVMKKWILNKEARKLKVKSIATGHNLDDETETFLLNVLKGSLGLSSKTGIITKNTKDKKFIPRIKPLFYIHKKDIMAYARKNKLDFVDGICPYREDSYRIEIRKFLSTLSNKEKENLMKNAEHVLKKIKKENSKIQYCQLCGEPSRKNICKKCGLMR